jgi:hypothetical protein
MMALIAILVLMSVAPAAADQATTVALNPPLPPNATDVHCSAGGEGTICHYTYSRVFGPRPYFDPGVTCPGGFTILAAGTIAPIEVTAFYNVAGNLQRSIAHYSFTGTLTNALSGKTLPYEGHATRTIDLVANTNKFTGEIARVHVPGQGIVVLNAGLRLFESDTGPAIERGTRELDAQLCSLLA